MIAPIPAFYTSVPVQLTLAGFGLEIIVPSGTFMEVLLIFVVLE